MNIKNETIELKVYLFSFFIIMISMLVIDGIWLAVMFKRFYAHQIGSLLKESVSLLPALLFYVLYGVALSALVVAPALKHNTGYLEVLMLGALFGMVTYGTYDLSNLATLKNWPWIVTVVDIAWGSVLAGLLSVIATFTTRIFW
ncbi:DUF2177 family protein [Estrella lausannensis]|uniref:Conserved putative membrane protein n=1 Tax=Estrella lausannensis TaxID=483423 RepID=A0A0H5DPL5_9BACT|nr:DUF2177 family protein [Estrella lausannensis]CRX37943.1 Conserved putative membrane protein [Estrella lausannensis]